MLHLFHTLYSQVGKLGVVKYSFLSLISGLWGFLFVNLVTQIISQIIAGENKFLNGEYALLFSIVILFFIWTRKTLATAIVNLSQKLFWTLRKQILGLVLQANYSQLSGRKSKIYSALVNDANTLSSASMNIIDFFSASILSLACLVYLASISFVLFLVTLVTAVLGVLIYHYGSQRNVKNIEASRNLEDKFLDYFDSILKGFKEIFIEPKKGAAIYEEKIVPLANKAYGINRKAFTSFLHIQITGQVLFYILIASILIFFAALLKVNNSDTVRYVFTLLYLLGSIETIMVVLPDIMRAKIASNRLFDLKNELEQAHFSNPIAKTTLSKEEFEGIKIENIEFQYGENDKIFGIGPINFEINKGETAFIYGGNGSGKTTFINALLGICKPDKGLIRFNNIALNDENYPIYKTMFAVVFNDFYLFNELMGIEKVDMEKWQFYLNLFELQNKVKLEGLCFSTTDLSTGQRKRLALIAALLEQKPVLIIDEWAADQDPYFRKKFYTQIIPLLKEEGFTIIAITHDDKYYNCADKLYKMEEGKLTEEALVLYEANLHS